MKKLYAHLIAGCLGLILLLSAGAPAALQAQNQVLVKGTDFWFGFMMNHTGNGNISIFVSADATPANATVAVPGIGFTQNVAVPANSTVQVTLPAGAKHTAANSATTTPANLGVHVTSDVDVYVFALNAYSATTDASLALPTNTLGIDYILSAYGQTDGNYSANSGGLIVATQNGTVVEVTPTVNCSNGWVAGNTYTVNLNQGQTLFFEAAATFGPDLSGTRIKAPTLTCQTSDKPFVVIGGNRCTAVDACAACDHIFDVNFPINNYGKDYVVVPLRTRQGDRVRVMAVVNGTTYSINGVPQAPLNAGQFANHLVTAPSRIQSNNPVVVTQFSRGTTCDGVTSDPAMAVLTASDVLAATNVTVSGMNLATFSNHNMNVVTETANTGNITFNPAPILCEAWQVLAASPYSTRRCQIGSGNTTINSTGTGFNVLVYGFGSADSYLYCGAGVLTDNTFDIVWTDPVCANVPTAFTANSSFSSVTTYEWDWGDGSPVESGPEATHKTRTHTYATCDTFTINVKYIVGATEYCYSEDVIVHAKPTATLTAAPTSLCPGDVTTLTFDVTGTCGTAWELNWTLGGAPQTPITGTGDGPVTTQPVINGTTDIELVDIANTDPAAGCLTTVNQVVTITLNPPPTSAGPISGLASLCVTNGGTYTVPGIGDPLATYAWTVTPATGVVFTPSNTETQAFTFNNTGAYQISVTVTNPCGTSPASTFDVVIDPPPAVDITPTALTICAGENSGNLQLQNVVGNVVRWESSTSCDPLGVWTSIANTTPTYQSGALTVTTCFRAVVQSGSCPETPSPIATITVGPQTTAGLVSDGVNATGVTICANSTPPTLAVTGQVGDVVNWESRINCSGAITDEGNALSTTFTPAPSAFTQCYRARIQSGTCQALYTPWYPVFAEAPALGGIILGPSGVCPNGIVTLTLIGYTGSIARWEQNDAADCSGAWTPLVNNLPFLSINPVTAAGCWRAVTQGVTCGESYSPGKTVNLLPTAVGGDVTPAASAICAGTAAPALTLQNHSGTIIRWEASLGAGCVGPWTTWQVTSATVLSPGVLSQTTCFRAVLSAGACGVAQSVPAEVAVEPAPFGGAASGGAPVCAGGTPPVLLVTGQSGAIVRWESAATCNATVWTDEGGAGANPFSPAAAPAATTCYRAVIGGGNCGEAASTGTLVTVSPASVGGTLTGAKTEVCQGQPTGFIVLTGQTGQVVRWESATGGCGGPFTAITATSPVLSLAALDETTCFRAVVQNGTACGEVFSGTWEITAHPLPVGGQTTPSGATICAGDPAPPITLSGETGAILRWESSTNCAAPWTNEGNAGVNAFTPAAPAATRCYRAVIQSGTCALAFSTTTTITVNAGTVGGTLTPPTASVCAGKNATFQLLGAVGNVVRWEYSIDNGITFQTAAHTSTTWATGPLTTNTIIRAVVQNGGCGEAVSAVSTVTVEVPPTAGAATVTPTTVCQGQPVDLSLTGQVGTVVRWEISTDNGASWTSLPGSAAPLHTTTPGASAWYRAVVSNGGLCGQVTTNPVAVTVDGSLSAGAISGPATVCAGANGGALVLTGFAGNVQGWESSTSGPAGPFTAIPNSANQSFQLYFNLTQTTWYRATVASGTCGTATTAPVEITVTPATVAGTVTGPGAICFGQNATFNLSGQTGAVVRWECSTNNFASKTNVSNTTTSHTINNVQQTTWCRAVIQSGACAPVASAAGQATVLAGSQGGTVLGGTTVCAGGSASLKLTGASGTIVRWERAADCAFAGVITTLNHTSASFAATNLGLTACYRAVTQRGGCPETPSSGALINVSQPPAGGSTTGATTVCAGFNGGVIQLLGHTGTIAGWQTSTDGGASWAPAGGAGQVAYTYNNIVQTTWYRAVLTTAGCPPAYSTATEITVSKPSAAGTIVGGGAQACANVNAGALLLQGFAGNVVRWESAPDPAGPWTVAGPGMPMFVWQNLTATTYYKAIVQSGACFEVESPVASVEIFAPVVGGSVLGSKVLCGQTNSGTLILTGETGQVVRWEYSEDDWATTVQIPNSASTILPYLNVSTTRRYRAVVSNGPCGTATSDEAILTVVAGTAGGTLSADATVCRGQNGGTLELTGFAGTIERWEWTEASVGWTPSQSLFTQNTQLSYNNLVKTTRYRVWVTGPCGTATSNEIKITVDPASAGGMVTGQGAYCAGANPTLALTGYAGDIVDWEFSTDNFELDIQSMNVQTPAIMPMNVQQTTWYRAIVQSGVCPPAYSTVAEVRVDAATIGGEVLGATTVCLGRNGGALELTNALGDVRRWERSEGGCAGPWTPIFWTNPTLTYSNLGATTCFRAIVQNGVCAEQASDAALVQVAATTVPGMATGSTTVCAGVNTVALTLTGAVGSVIHWEKSEDPGFNVVTILNNPTINVSDGNLTTTTWYRAVVQNGTCPPAKSLPAVVTVDQPSDAGLASANATVCAGANAGEVSVTNIVGEVLLWQRAEMGGVNPVDINHTSATLSYNNITATTWYRAVVQNGVCPAAFGDWIEVNVDPATVAGATIGGGGTVCFGQPAGQIDLIGSVGQVVRWEGSTDFGGTWTDLGKAGFTSFLSGPLTSTTWFRAIVKSGVCPELASTHVVVNVPTDAIGGVIAGPTSTCQNNSSGLLTLTNYTGTITGWEFSTDGGANWNPVVPTIVAPSYTSGPLTQTTRFRAVIAAGACGNAFSTEHEVVVDPLTAAGTINAAPAFCASSPPVDLTLTGQTGDVLEWEQSLDGGASWTSLGGAAQTTIQTPPLTQTTRFRARVQSGQCAAQYTPELEVSANSLTQGGAVSPSVTTVCPGPNTATLTLTGALGTILYWESALTPDFATGYQQIATTTTTLTVTNATETRYYRAVVQNANCPPQASTTGELKVAPPVVLNATGLAGCGTRGGIQATATGGGGSGYVYSIAPAAAPSNGTGLFNDLPSGNYDVTVTDALGCTATTPVVVPAGGTPTIVSAVATGQKTATVSWTPVSGATGYAIRYRVPGGTWIVLNLSTTTTVNLTNLTAGTSYEVEVAARCGNVTQAFSPPAVFTTSPGACTDVPPAVPGGLTVTNVTANSALAQWNPVVGAQGYIISFGLSNLSPNTWPQFVVCAPATNFLMSGLTPGRSYGVRVRTNCSNCTTALNNADKRSAWSAMQTWSTPISKDEVSSAPAAVATVYPNPTTGAFTVALTDAPAGPVALELTDAAGRRLWSATYAAAAGPWAQSVEPRGLAAGVYLLRLRTGDGVTRSLKLVRE